MKKKKLIGLSGSICLVLALAALLLWPTASSAGPQFKWRFQCAFGEADFAYALNTKTVAKLIEEASEGQIEVTTYSAGALVAPEEMYSSLVDGTIEGTENMSMNEAQIVPECLLLALHGGAQDINELYELVYKRGIFDMVRQAYQEKGAHLLVTCMNGEILLRARKTGVLDSWNSFKGTKGFASPPLIPVLTQLGGTCVEVPGFDMYSAMKLGSIDWHEWSIAELESLGWKEVTKTVLLSPITQMGAENVLINRKAWEAIGPELQEKIHSVVLKNVMDMGKAYVAENHKAIAASKEYGVEFIEMSEADKAKFYELCVKDWDSIATMSPRCGKGIEIAKDFLKSKGRL